MIVVLYRPLLLSSVSAELAAARGIPVRLVGLLYLLAMALAVALSAVTIGAILSTALLVGPAASALLLTRAPRPGDRARRAIGVATTWLGILLAWDSYYWPPLHHGWPVSFFVVTLVLIVYLASRGSCAAPASSLSPVFSGFMVNAWIVATIVASSAARSGSSSSCAARRSSRTQSPTARSPAPPPPA